MKLNKEEMKTFLELSDMELRHAKGVMIFPQSDGTYVLCDKKMKAIEIGVYHELLTILRKAKAKNIFQNIAESNDDLEATFVFY
ncbi:hypothetical protein EV201_1282 [Ancylomarina subtilis]|uniref:Uncharacterized protein n=1 Tax=Ancylomarina subtilis TaxID=1639035 RepID=A0A4Q7VK79_9BACT|nr:hypothetical protein [Ancylomarina subtilis]RZT96641.1 hypothetical protein EV201_1282 [Ancylomarina subtilis]